MFLLKIYLHALLTARHYLTIPGISIFQIPSPGPVSSHHVVVSDFSTRLYVALEKKLNTQNVNIAFVWE